MRFADAARLLGYTTVRTASAHIPDHLLLEGIKWLQLPQLARLALAHILAEARAHVRVYQAAVALTVHSLLQGPNLRSRRPPPA